MHPIEHEAIEEHLHALCRSAVAGLEDLGDERVALRDGLDAGDLLVLAGRRGFVADRALIAELERALVTLSRRVPDLCRREAALRDDVAAMMPVASLRARALLASAQLSEGLIQAYRGLSEAEKES